MGAFPMAFKAVADWRNRRRPGEQQARIALIDRDRKLLFLHIPKTGGTAVTLALAGSKAPRSHLPLRYYLPVPEDRRGCGAARSIQYARLRERLIRRRDVRWIDADFFVFTIVRNPWARVVSFYRNVLRGAKKRRRLGIRGTPSFHAFLIHHSRTWQLKPQLYWLKDWDGAIACDRIAYFERLQEEWQALKPRLGIDRDLPRVNQALEADCWRDYYDATTRALVAEWYREEIDYLGYRFD